MATVSTGGLYTLTVINPITGCAESKSMSVNENKTIPDLNITASSQITCNTPTVTLQANSAASNLSYIWTTADGSIDSGANTANPVVSAAGTYVLIIQDLTNGCEATDSIEITGTTELFVSVNMPDTITCATTSVNLTASSSSVPVTYSWTTPNGTIISGANAATAVVSNAGVYTITIVNTETNCVASQSVTVIEQTTLPTVSIATPDILTCNQTSLNLVGTSDITEATYAWTTQNGNILSGANTSTALIDAPGTYLLTVTNTHTGCVNSNEVVVNQSVETPIVAITPPDTLTCAVTEISLMGSSDVGRVTYAWSTVDGSIVSGSANPVAVVNTAGTYTLTVTDTINGCASSVDVQVVEDITSPLASIASPDTLTCAVTEISLIGSSNVGRVTYAWSTVDGSIVSGSANPVAVVNAAGTYTLTVTDTINGCASSVDVQVVEDITSPLASIASPDTLTCAVTEISLIGSSNVGRVTYAWSTVDGSIVSGSANPVAVVNTAGTYTLTVTDTINGCTSSVDVQVVEDITSPLASIASPDTLTCAVTEISLLGSSDVGRVTYAWSTVDGSIVSGSANPVAVVNAAGTYTLTVTDTINGCTSSVDVQVVEDITSPLASIASPDT